MRMAAATMNPLSGTRDHAGPDQRARRWDRRRGPGQWISTWNRCAPLVTSRVSGDSRAGRCGRGAAEGDRTCRVQRPDRPARRKRSLRDRHDARPAAADQGRGLGIRLGARRRPSGAGEERLGDRQRRRYEHPAAGTERPASAGDRHARPVARPDGSRRHQRDHAGDSRPGKPGRNRVTRTGSSSSRCRRTSRSVANESAGQHSPRRYGQRRRDDSAQGI